MAVDIPTNIGEVTPSFLSEVMGLPVSKETGFRPCLSVLLFKERKLFAAG